MPIERESKSWAWVNERRCDECGFDAAATDHRDVAAILVHNRDDWVRLLGGDAEQLVARPDDRTWSPLEYGCHVRDVLELLVHRWERTMAEDHPVFDDWHPDDRAAAGDYAAERDPISVREGIVRNADRAIALASRMSAADWLRRGTRADGLEFTNAWLATYLTHDVVHHVWDVERILG